MALIDTQPRAGTLTNVTPLREKNSHLMISCGEVEVQCDPYRDTRKQQTETHRLPEGARSVSIEEWVESTHNIEPLAEIPLAGVMAPKTRTAYDIPLGNKALSRRRLIVTLEPVKSGWKMEIEHRPLDKDLFSGLFGGKGR